MIKTDSQDKFQRCVAKKSFFLISFLLILITSAVPYFRGVNGDFVFDDIPLIQDDPFYKTEQNPVNCWKRSFWSEKRSQGLYRPLTLFSYWATAKSFSLDSPLFRKVNLLLHVGVCLLIFILGLKIRMGRLYSLGAALIFAAHPIHSEAVVPSFGRGELLCCLFLLLGLILHVGSSKKSWLVFPAGISFILSCFSKEHGVVFFPIAIIISAYLNKPLLISVFREKHFIRLKRFIVPYLFYLMCVTFVFVCRFLALGQILPEKKSFFPFVDNQLDLVPADLRIVSAIRIHGIALFKYVWPSELSHDYSYAELLPSESLFDPVALAVLLVLILIPLFLMRLQKNFRWKILFLSAAYILCILPAGNFFITSGTIFAERLQYIPTVWLSFLTIFLLSLLTKKIPRYRFTVNACLLLFIIIAMSARTWVRCGDWDSRMTLAVSGIKTAPDSVKTWYNLAVQFEALAEKEKNKAYLWDAVNACNRALDIYPEYLNCIANRGTYYTRLGKFSEAEKDFKFVLSKDSFHTQAFNNLGIVYANTNRKDEAREIWEESLKHDPNQPHIIRDLKRLISEIETPSGGKSERIK